MKNAKETSDKNLCKNLKQHKFYGSQWLNNIDIMEIKRKVETGSLRFYTRDNYIYCKNLLTDEIVIVGNVGKISIMPLKPW